MPCLALWRAGWVLDLEPARVGGPDVAQDAVGVGLGVGFAALWAASAGGGDAVVMVAELVRKDVQELEGSCLCRGPAQLEGPVAEAAGEFADQVFFFGA